MQTPAPAQSTKRRSIPSIPLWVKITIGIVASNYLSATIAQLSCLPYDPSTQTFDPTRAPIFFDALSALHLINAVCGGF